MGYELYDPSLNPVIGEKFFTSETSIPDVTSTHGTGVSFPKDKPACETNHSLLSRVDVKNEWSCASTPLYLRDVCRGTFTATLVVRNSYAADYSICFYLKKTAQKVFLFRNFRHIRHQGNVFSPLGDETQGNFQGENACSEAESTVFSEINERCFEHV